VFLHLVFDAFSDIRGGSIGLRTVESYGDRGLILIRSAGSLPCVRAPVLLALVGSSCGRILSGVSGALSITNTAAE
jgi:hypothetical protein